MKNPPLIGLNRINATVAITAADTTTLQTVEATTVAGETNRLVLTNLSVNGYFTTSGTWTVRDASTGNVFAQGAGAANSTINCNLTDVTIPCTPGENVTVVTSQAGAIGVTAEFVSVSSNRPISKGQPS